jgi:hypothetical protein
MPKGISASCDGHRMSFADATVAFYWRGWDHALSSVQWHDAPSAPAGRELQGGGGGGAGRTNPGTCLAGCFRHFFIFIKE